ncbi:MAG TPA: GYF domain-containing protein [Kofleriaceae bacterium]|nr:GYF domain-containing protein [Kofleriaceae bacterium]
MKFLCDRCKTRYSIGDDRVRGKILKIRCKNCANVITVREGMPDADVADAAGAPRRNKTTTQAPPSVHEAPTVPAPSSYAAAATQQPQTTGRGNALGAAFASAMAKPPPALEEEWYVSIDGDQAGPFSLAEAQRWVGSKPYDAELHCWSEGFDDWLPVDKVSHFRGLRKKPAPAPAPPPLPRVTAPGPAVRAPTLQAQSRPVAHAHAPIDESEPKPLFAATMASLEKNAPPQPASTRTLGLPPLGRATPPAGYAAPALAKTNGAHAPQPQPPAPSQPIAQQAKPALPSPVTARNATAPGMGAQHAKKSFGFDASETVPSAAESATVIQAQRFETPQPVAEAKRDPFFSKDAAATTPSLSASAAVDAANDAIPEGPEHDDLDIGEVSRVVKLADLMKPAPSQAAASRRSGPIAPLAANQAGRASGSIGKLTSSNPKLGATLPVPLIDAVDVVPTGAPAEIAHEPSAPVGPAVSHRRGLIALLVGAAILVGAAVVVVVLVLENHESSTGLGDKYDLDTERPDDVVVRRGDQAPNEPPPNPFVPRKYRPVQPKIDNTPPPTPGGNTLQAEEIESMANRSNGLTARCFMRASKGTDGILLGDVKKVTVTLSIKPDGTVSDVGLSDNHASDTLGRCLIGFIRTWKFRESPGGTFRFVLARPEV